MVSKGLSSPSIKCQVPHRRFSPLPGNIEYLHPPLKAPAYICSVS